jgi:hypothetical protein
MGFPPIGANAHRLSVVPPGPAVVGGNQSMAPARRALLDRDLSPSAMVEECVVFGAYARSSVRRRALEKHRFNAEPAFSLVEKGSKRQPVL